MRKLVALVFLLIIALPSLARAQAYNALSYTAGSFNTAGCSGGGGVCFADLTGITAQYNGTITYCKDCQQTAPCQAGGSGAIAMKISGVWACASGSGGAGGTCPVCGSCGPAVTDLIQGPGILQLTATPGTSSFIKGASVNGVANALAFTGTDIGAQVNAAEATLPGTLGSSFNFSIATHPGTTGTGKQGTVRIPNGSGGAAPITYTFNTTIVLDQNVTLDCDPGVVLSYTGATDAVLQNNPGNNGQWTASGGVTNCTILKASTNSNTGVNGIHAGNTNGLTYTKDYIGGFKAIGDSGMLIENTVYFTEHSRIDIAAEQNYHAITFKRGSGANPSFGYNWVRLLHCGPVYGGYGDCINVIGGGSLYGSYVEIHANTIGLGQALFALDSTSVIGNDSIDVSAENDASPASASYMVKAAAGGQWSYNVGPVNLSGSNGGFADANQLNGIVGLYLDPVGFHNWVRMETPGTVSLDYQGTGDAALWSGPIHTNQIAGVGTTSITGGGFLATGSNSTWGSIGTPAATGNVLTLGSNCPNMQVILFKDITGNADSISITAETKTTVTFNANSNAGHSLNYWAGCI